LNNEPVGLNLNASDVSFDEDGIGKLGGQA
jgi:hypothetical protein